MSSRPRPRCSWVAVCLTLLLCSCRAETPNALPNIVVVLSDSLRAANLPFYGYGRDTAPRLSELAQESIVFAHHLANYPATPFSVSQMFSGRLMSPLLMGFAPSRVPLRKLPDDLLILPRELRDLGYRTGIVTSHPWFGEDARVLDYFDEREVTRNPSGAYAPFEALRPQINRFLDTTARDERPFFLYVHTMDTHAPMNFHEGHDSWRDSKEASEIVNAYDSEIHYTDRQVGHLLDDLRSRELLDKTIFVFTSDHGEEFGEMGPEWWNHGHGTTLRRALLHVPLLIRLPKGKRAGSYPALSKHLDLAPTLLRLAKPDLDLSAFSLDGQDLSAPILAEQAPAEADVSFSYNWSSFAAHDRDSELHYDQWDNTVSRYRVQPDADNYPRLQPAPDSPAAVALEGALTARRDAAVQELSRMENLDDAPDPAMIGLPTRVEHKQGGVPSLQASATDNRWHLLPPTLLEARAGETPEALVLSMPWIEGTYTVSVRLSAQRVKRGYANAFRVQLLGSDNAAVQVDGAEVAAPYLVLLGEQKIGRQLRVRFSEPRGDVGISGFLLRRVGLSGGNTPALSPELEVQLRELGYLE